MLLDKQQIKDFQEILEEEFEEKISYDEATELAYGFLELGFAKLHDWPNCTCAGKGNTGAASVGELHSCFVGATRIPNW